MGNTRGACCYTTTLYLRKLPISVGGARRRTDPEVLRIWRNAIQPADTVKRTIVHSLHHQLLDNRVGLILNADVSRHAAVALAADEPSCLHHARFE